MASIRAIGNVIAVPSLPQDAAEQFISKLVLKNFVFDDGGREIPELDPIALDVLDRLSDDSKRRIFTARSHDPVYNYEDLEFIGDSALKYTISRLIEKQHRDLNRAWRHTLRARLTSRPCMSRIALGLGLQDRVLVGKGRQISQAILEDVIESIAGAIQEELGMEELYAWTLAVFEPMTKAYRDVLVEQAIQAGHDPHKWTRVAQSEKRLDPNSAGSSAQTRPTVATSDAPASPNYRKRSHSETQQEPADQVTHPVSSFSESSSKVIEKELLRSRADVQNYCSIMGYTLTWETLGSKRQHGQDIWRERMTIAGKYQAVGESSAKKRAQAAAAEAMIRSGVLEDFPAYIEERRKRRRMNGDVL